MKKRYKKFGIAAAVLVGLGVILLITLPLLVDVNRYRGLVESKAEAALGREVSLGEMQLSLLPVIGLRVDDVTIAGLAEEGDAELLSARRLRVGARLFPLLRGRLEVTSIVVEGPRLVLARGPGGEWNVARLLASSATTESETSSSTSAAEPPDFHIGSLSIVDARIELRDASAGSAPRGLTLSDVELQLSDVVPDGPVAFELSAAWEEVPEARLSLSGRAGPLFREEHEPMQIEAGAELSAIDVASLIQALRGFYEVPGELIAGDALSVTAGVRAEIGPSTRVELSDVAIEGLALSLRRDSRGRWNLPAGSEAPSGAARPGDSAGREQGGMELTLSGLEIRDSRLSVEDALLPENSRTFSVEIDRLALDRLPFEHTATIELAGVVDGTGALEVRGVIGPIGSAASGVPLELALSLDPVPRQLFGLVAVEGVELGSEAGTASVALDISGLVPEEFRAHGRARAAGFEVRLAGPGGERRVVPLDLGVDYDVSVAGAGARLKLDKLALDVSGNPLALRGSIEKRSDLQQHVDIELLPSSVPADELAGLLTLLVGELPVSFASTAPIEFRARVHGLVGQGRLPQIDGGARLREFSFMHAALSQPLSQVNATLTVTGESVDVEGLSGVVGVSDFAGDVRLRGFTDPHVEFELRSNNADFGELFSFLREAEQGEAGSPAEDAETAPGEKATSALDRLTLEGDIRIARGSFDTLKFSDLDAHMRWAEGKMTLQPVRMQLYDGAFQGRVTSDLSGEQPSFDVHGDADGVDIDAFLAENLGSSGLLQGRFYGKVETHTVGADYESLVRGLSGTGTVEVQQGRVGGLDILQTLSSVSGMFGEDTLRSLSGQLATEGTEFEAMSGGVRFDGGRMWFDHLAVNSPFFHLEGGGAVDLLSASLDGEFKLALSSELSASMRTEGSRAGELFWNPGNRQVEVPFSLSGPFSAPRPSVDWNSVVQTAVRGRAEDELRSFIAKKLGATPEPAPAESRPEPPSAAPAPASPPAGDSAAEPTTSGLSVQIREADWGGSLLAPDLELVGQVGGASIERAEISVVDARGLQIRSADRLRDVDAFLGSIQSHADNLTIPWRYEVDGKKLLLASFPVSVTVIVFDKTGARAEAVVEVNR